MRIFLLVPIIFLPALGSAYADVVEEKLVEITFEMHSPELDEESRVFIAGSVASLGNWRPNASEMKLTQDHTWTLQVSVPSGATIEYKYTLGTWAKEGARVDGQPLPNFRLTPKRSEIRKDRIRAWTNRKPRVTEGQVTGELRYHRQLESHGLRPRNLVVWLPPNYESDKSRDYPVLYMHDGQNLFDPRTSAFGVDWQVDETMTDLVQSQQIEPLIVVGICNTRDRSEEYTLGELGDLYRDFVVNKVKPFIDSEYRTQPEREHTFVGGSSAGGLCAFVLAWEHAEVFSGALCMSPAFRVERSDGSISIDYVSQVLSSTRPNPSPRLYIDNGGQGVDSKLMDGVTAMIEALRKKGYVDDTGFQVVIARKDPHNESAWARRFPAAIVSLIQ